METTNMTHTNKPIVNVAWKLIKMQSGKTSENTYQMVKSIIRVSIRASHSKRGPI
jgi:hypothetical protein